MPSGNYDGNLLRQQPTALLTESLYHHMCYADTSSELPPYEAPVMVAESVKFSFFLFYADALLTVSFPQLELHCCRWRKIEDGSEYIQSLQAIPWPPFSAGTLHCMAGGCHCSDNHLNTTKCCTLLSHCSQAADQLRVMALITAVYRVLERKHICLLHSVFSD